MSLFGSLLGAAGTFFGGPLGGAIGSTVGSLLGGSNASSGARANQNTAAQYADQTKWQNAGISAGGYNVTSDNGNISGSISDPTNQNLAQSLYGQGSGLMSQFSGGTQIPPELLQALQQANGQMGGIGAQGGSILSGLMQGMGQTGNQLGMNAAMGGNYSTRQGNGFMGMGNAALGQLGSFDPTQAGQNYSSMLDQSQQQGNQTAADSMAQRLYNSGMLGSTGGANQMGMLEQQQNMQHMQNQIAGQQLGQGQQMNLAGMAQSLGQTGQGMNLAGINSNNQSNQTNYGLLGNMFSQGLGAQNQQFNQGMSLAQQPFANASSAYGQGLSTNQQTLQGALGALGLGQSFSQADFSNLLNTIGMGINNNSQMSNANVRAYNPQLQAGVAANNTQTAGNQGILGSIFGSNAGGSGGGLLGALGGLFGGGGQQASVNNMGMMSQPFTSYVPNFGGG